MGARGTIRIKQFNQDTAVHLYAHWAGPDMPKVLAKGLERAEIAGRLDDQAYCSRIIFDTLSEYVQDSTLGCGMIIGDECAPGDLSYDVPCVEWTSWGEPICYVIPVDDVIACDDTGVSTPLDTVTAQEFISDILEKDLTGAW